MDVLLTYIRPLSEVSIQDAGPGWVIRGALRNDGKARTTDIGAEYQRQKLGTTERS